MNIINNGGTLKNIIFKSFSVIVDIENSTYIIKKYNHRSKNFQKYFANEERRK